MTNQPTNQPNHHPVIVREKPHCILANKTPRSKFWDLNWISIWVAEAIYSAEFMGLPHLYVCACGNIYICIDANKSVYIYIYTYTLSKRIYIYIPVKKCVPQKHSPWKSPVFFHSPCPTNRWHLDFTLWDNATILRDDVRNKLTIMGI